MKDSPNNRGHKQVRIVVGDDDDDDDDGCLLSSCEKGSSTSVDSSTCTASLSDTQENLLLSSFSNDTVEEETLSPRKGPPLEYRATEVLRHRHTATSVLVGHGHPEHDEDHHHLDHEDYEDEFDSCSEGDHDYCEYKDHYYHGGGHDDDSCSGSDLFSFSCWMGKHSPDYRRRRKLAVSVPLLLLTGLGLCWLGSYAVRYYYMTPRWKLPNRPRTQLILNKLQMHPVGRHMTLRIRGSRMELLQQSLDRHAHCPVVSHVQIDWTAASQVPIDLLDHSSFKVEDAGSRDKRVPTDAVFLLDESVLLSCHDLDRAWKEWLEDPSRLVGFLPLAAGPTNNNWSSSSSSSHDPTAAASFSLVSDAAVLLHRFYLRAAERHAVLRPAECQHVALSAWVTALSGTSPTAMMASSSLSMHHSPTETTPDYCLERARQATGLSSMPRSTAMVARTLPQQHHHADISSSSSSSSSS